MSLKINQYRMLILGLILSVFLSSGCVGGVSKQSPEIEKQPPQTTSVPTTPPPTHKPEYSTPEKTAETFWKAIEFKNYDYAFKALNSDWNKDEFDSWMANFSELNMEGVNIQYSDTVDVQITGGGYYATGVVYIYWLWGSFSIPMALKTYFVKEPDGWKISYWELLEGPKTSRDTQEETDEFLQNTSTSIGTRQNPAPIGTTLTVKFEYWGDDYEANVTLLKVIRGVEAWKRIQKAASYYNKPPREGFEYILAKIRFEYLKGPKPDVIYEVSTYSFDVISSEGKEYENPDVVEPEPELSARLYPGATHEGWAAFEVAVNDSQPVLTFGRDYQGRGGIWFKLYN